MAAPYKNLDAAAAAKRLLSYYRRHPEKQAKIKFHARLAEARARFWAAKLELARCAQEMKQHA
jgi:hypothetical protein